MTKAVTWRCVGTLDTFIWSALITHKAVSAATIAGLEVFTKIALFYVHERVWRMSGRLWDHHSVSFAKAVSWRFFGSLDTMILSWLVTGKFRYAVTIAGAEAVTKIVLYYGHERIWRLVRWGKIDLEIPPEPATTATVQ